MKKEMVMKNIAVLLSAMVLLVLVHGCSIAPQDLPISSQESHDANLRGSVEVPVSTDIVAGKSDIPMEWKGFAVLDFQAKRDSHGMVFVVGEVKNVGKAIKGVELQAVLRDTQNRVVAVGSFCPAANHSIVPTETRPFAHSFGRYDSAVHVEVRIIRTFYTMDTLGMAALAW